MKDQIGSFFYFPSTNFQKAAGGFGPIRINNRIVIAVPFPKPEDEFDLLIGDWYNQSYKVKAIKWIVSLIGLDYPLYYVVTFFIIFLKKLLCGNLCWEFTSLCVLGTWLMGRR